MPVPHLFSDEAGAIKRPYLDANFAAVSLGSYVTPQSFGAAGNGVADDTVAIRKAVDSSRFVMFPAGTYRVTGVINLTSGQVLIGPGTVVQSSANTEIFNFESRSDISVTGLTLQGFGTDFTNSDSSRAVAFYGGGAGSNNNRFHNNKFVNFTYTSVKFKAQTNCFFTSNIVVGPGPGILTPIVSGACYGVLFDEGCFRVHCEGNSLSACAQGLIMQNLTDGVFSDNTIFDIVGQHGMYCGQALYNVAIVGNTIRNVDLIGIKSQSFDASGFDNVNISVTGNTIFDCGDQGIVIGSGDEPGSVFKNRNVAVVGNTVRQCGANGISLNNSEGIVVSSNSIQGCVFSGIYVSECVDFLIAMNNIRSCNLSGIRDGLANSNGIIRANKLLNVAVSGTVGDRFGILFQVSTDIAVDANVIGGSAGTMQYGVFLNGGPTFSVTDNESLAATDCGARFQLTTPARAYKGNRWGGTLAPTLNDPAAPTVASVANLVLPQDQDVILVSGTSTITSIPASGHSGRTVQLVFQGVLTVTDGSNLRLAGNFVTTADDTLTLGCDGVNWYEAARSVN